MRLCWVAAAERFVGDVGGEEDAGYGAGGGEIVSCGWIAEGRKGVRTR